jgi:hypothetical protein
MCGSRTKPVTMSSLRARVGPAYLLYRGQAERILHPGAFQVALVKFAVSQWWPFGLLPTRSLFCLRSRCERRPVPRRTTFWKLREGAFAAVRCHWRSILWVGRQWSGGRNRPCLGFQPTDSTCAWSRVDLKDGSRMHPRSVCGIFVSIPSRKSRSWTDVDRLRHSKFVGLRDDKNPREVVKEAQSRRGDVPKVTRGSNRSAD